MQIMLDTLNTPTVQLRAVAQLILEACDARDEMPTGFNTGDDTAVTTAELDAGQQLTDPATVGFGRAPLETIVAPPPATAAPPPPPAASIVAPTAAPLTGAEVDSVGATYDPRIHSSSKAKNVDGRWKKRRGSTAATTAPVTPPPPATTAAPPPPPPATSDSGAGVVQVAAEAALAPPPPPPAMPAAVPPPPPPPVVAVDAPSFRSVVAKINAATAAKTLTEKRVQELLVAAGVASGEMQTLITRADLVAPFDALLSAELAGK